MIELERTTTADVGQLDILIDLRDRCVPTLAPFLPEQDFHFARLLKNAGGDRKNAAWVSLDQAGCARGWLDVSYTRGRAFMLAETAAAAASLFDKLERRRNSRQIVLHLYADSTVISSFGRHRRAATAYKWRSVCHSPFLVGASAQASQREWITRPLQPAAVTEAAAVIAEGLCSPHSPRQPIEAISGELARSEVITVTESDRIVGVLAIQRQSARYAYLKFLAVAEQFRRQGVANALLKEGLLNENTGANAIIVDYLLPDSAAAGALYECWGFAPVAAVPVFRLT